MRKPLARWMLLGVLWAGTQVPVAWAGPSKSSPRRPLIVSGVVNLNEATPAQLDLLPGVGEKAAALIIEHRTKTPFLKPEELVRVKGFGRKRFRTLRPHLVVTGPTTLRVQRKP